ncbi:hypothetical protein BDR26DRAFT_850741 [Obelidium mucronatum]|nr:hypothetical protein BDR26DRAFT_850741 [Obelidium mucronatum]
MAVDPRATDATIAMDSLLHLETMLEQSGFDDGFRDGLELGLSEGRDLGSRIAIKTAREVGFYLGVSRELLNSAAAAAAHDDDNESSVIRSLVHDRAVRVLESVVSLSESFPRTNDHSLDIVPLLEKIRGKFRLATVLLKMPQLKFDLDTNSPVFDISVSMDNESSSASTASKRVDLTF